VKVADSINHMLGSVNYDHYLKGSSVI